MMSSYRKLALIFLFLLPFSLATWAEETDSFDLEPPLFEEGFFVPSNNLEPNEPSDNIETPPESEKPEINSPTVILLPDEQQISIKPNIKIKGINRHLTPVYVNDKKLNVRMDGRFYDEYTLTGYGKKIVRFTFFTPEFEKIELDKKILHLLTPPDIEKFSTNRTAYIYVFNSPYIYNPTNNRTLSSPFTRADLAHFIGQLTQLRISGSRTEQFDDVNNDYWAADIIYELVKRNIMSEFPDGRFKPERPVSKIEYIISVVRALELPLDDSGTTLPYSDVDLFHWTAKFIRTARNFSFIPQVGVLKMHDDLTLADFASLAGNIPEVKQYFDQLLNFSEGYELEREEKYELERFIREQLSEYKSEMENQSKVSFESPQNNDIIYSLTAPFKGRIFPSEIFSINSLDITPDPDGYFSLVLPLTAGKNSFTIEAHGKQSTMNVFSLTGFSDLKGHWVEETAAKLKYIGIMNQTEEFHPKKKITRGELAAVLVNAFQLVATPDTQAVPQDVSIAEQHFAAILTAVQLNLMEPDENGFFYPKKECSKVEVVQTVLRTLPNPLEDNIYAPLPFKDIRQSDESANDIALALKQGIISAGNYFFPNKPVTKAELAAMVSKADPISNQLKEIFE